MMEPSNAKDGVSLRKNPVFVSDRAAVERCIGAEMVKCGGVVNGDAACVHAEEDACARVS